MTVHRGRNFATIAGAGLVGSFLAISLARRGIGVDVLEKRGRPERNKAKGGRSINLALSKRGIDALKTIGLWDAVRGVALPVTGRAVHSIDGKISLQPYGTSPDHIIHSLARRDLQLTLLKGLQEEGVVVEFDRRIETLDLESRHLGVCDEKTGEIATRKFNVLFGADGSSSIVRKKLLNHDDLHAMVDRSDFGYKEILLPAAMCSALDQRHLHIWPRGNFMLMALPNIDGSFCATLFLPLHGTVSFERLVDEIETESFVSSYFADLCKSHLAKMLSHAPLSKLSSIFSPQWHYKGQCLLIGDSAQSILPFLGQGLNCGLESSRLLLEKMDAHPRNWCLAFEEFQSQRMPDVLAIGRLTYDNFIEMRDHVSSPLFLHRKRVERELASRYPCHFISKYEMITFSSIPYSEVESRAIQQDKILDAICCSGEKFNWTLAEELVAQLP